MRRLTVAGEAVVVLAFCLSGTGIAGEVKTIQNAVAGDWPSYHRTYDSTRYSPLDQISKGNVHRLSVAWAHQAVRSRRACSLPQCPSTESPHPCRSDFAGHTY